jgi:uncharacterized protein (TIGR02271 family)
MGRSDDCKGMIEKKIFSRRSEMINRTELSEGMTVRSSDGDKLGKIIAIDDQGILLEKGIFFPKEYQANFDQLDQVWSGDLYLKWGTHLVEQQYDSYYGQGSYEKETADEGLWSDYNRKDSEQSIPVSEEELRVDRKGMEEVGRVRVYKTVSTEDQHFTVPVTREQVHIERVPASDMNAQSDDSNIDFKDDTVTIPVREEQVEITKRPKVREEIRVKKTTEQVDQEVSGTVRKEKARIEREGGLDQDMHP